MAQSHAARDSTVTRSGIFSSLPARMSLRSAIPGGKVLATSRHFPLTPFNFNCRTVSTPRKRDEPNTTWHGDHMPKLSRKGEGKPLREAMERAGLTIEELAQATKEVDPAGKGISPATVGRLTSRGKSARTNCELSTAWFVAEALHKETNAPLQDLFAMPTDSTSTVERSRSDAAHEG